MKRYGRPDAIVTDRLRSYRAALRELGGSGLQQAGRWLNNRAGTVKLSRILGVWGRNRSDFERRINNLWSVQSSE